MEPEQKSSGALVGLIIIIIILVLGGVYLWINNTSKETETADPISSNENKADNKDGVTVDNTLDLDANINSIDLESLDSEI